MKELFIRAHMIEDDEERDLVIADGVIADADPVPGTEPDAAGWVLPGLVDVHNHLSLASPAGDDQDADVRVRASASVELALGVLAIREPGSPDDASTRLAGEDGWPRVITAGRFLAPPAGYFPDLAREVTTAELPSAAEQEARRSGGWAKIIGDYLGPGGRFVPNWPADVLAAAATRVHAIGGRSSRRSQRRRYIWIHSSASSRSAGSSRHWRMRPRFWVVTRCACSRIRTCFSKPVMDMPNGWASSLTLAGPSDSRSRISRRVGSASAANVRSSTEYLTI